MRNFVHVVLAFTLLSGCAAKSSALPPNSRDSETIIPYPDVIDGLPREDDVGSSYLMEIVTRCALIGLAAVVVWGLWRAGQPRVVFAVRISNGEAKAAAGTVTPAFLHRVAEL